MVALEIVGPNKNKIDGQKSQFRAFLDKMFIGHFSITSASANYRTAMHMQQKQDGEIKFSMMGGMSKVGVALSFPY